MTSAGDRGARRARNRHAVGSDGDRAYGGGSAPVGAGRRGASARPPPPGAG